MGHGIALELARGGFQVRMYDSAPGRSRAAMEEIRQDAADLVEAGVLERGDVDRVIDRVCPCDGMEEAVAGVEFVEEAIIEDLEAKRRVFAELDRLCPPPVVLASNTSSISVTEIAEACEHPERVVLAHFSIPPHLLPAVEVAPGDRTDQATVEATCELLESIDKWPIRIRKDIPGYLLNRIQYAMVREALALVADGIATPEDIDRLLRGTLARRMPVLGVFRQLDLAGVDVYHSVFQYVAAHLNASPDPPAILAEKLAAGRAGAGRGGGFYAWGPGELEEFTRRRNAELIRMLRADREG